MSSESAVAQSRGWITWSSLGLGVTGIGQFALLAALARMLGPSDFGVVTAVLVVIGAGRVVHASIGPALVQRAELRAFRVARRGLDADVGAIEAAPEDRRLLKA